MTASFSLDELPDLARGFVLAARASALPRARRDAVAGRLAPALRRAVAGLEAHLDALPPSARRDFLGRLAARGADPPAPEDWPARARALVDGPGAPAADPALVRHLREAAHRAGTEG